MDTAFANRLVITVAAQPPTDAQVCIRIVGDVDMTGEPVLSQAVDRLRALSPRTVVVDLAGVTFACSTLVTFLVRLHKFLPDGTSLVLCRPTPMTRRVLELTRLNHIVPMRDDLPWPGETVRHHLDASRSATEADPVTRVAVHPGQVRFSR